MLNMIKMDVYRMFRTKSMYVIWIILLASALLTSFLSKIDYDAANKEWEKQQAVESQADTDTDMQWKERLPGEIVLAMIPGIMLLLLGMLTRGLLGEGDGWFFIVSGFFLGWQECVMLLISGQIFCGIFGLAIMVGAQIGTGRENIRKLRLPFLPFLLPASLWMVLMRMI